jgi:excisionase family DNA binding protein
MKVYHRPELVRILGFSESTMRRLIKNKKIKFTKPNGKDYQFKKSDLILFKKAG